jgi:hypothetical protein
MQHAGATLLFVAVLEGCSSDCPQQGAGYSEVGGTPADFLTAPGPGAGYEISAPAECASDDGTAHVIAIEGTGWRTLAAGGCSVPPETGSDCPTLDPTFVGARLVNQLRGLQIDAVEPWECAGEIPGALIDDWKSADAAVERVATTVAEWELSGSVVVVVGPFAYQASRTEC